MKLKLPAVLIVVIVCMLALAGGAHAAKFEGLVKGQPGSEITFKLVKVNGKRRVTDVRYYDLQVACDGMLPNAVQSAGVAGSARLRAHRRFDLREESAIANKRFAGRLKPNRRKATGLLRARTEVGGPFGTCNSGKLEWVATKLVN
jgi:hypothetical protein